MYTGFVAGAFGLVGAGLLVAAGLALRRTLLLRRTGTRSRATVTELKARDLKIRSANEPASDDTVYAPVFEFATPGGRIQRVEGVASSPPRYAVGDRVDVLFDPAEPAGARIDSFTGLWLGVVLTSIGGGLACAVALVLLYFAR